MFKRVCDQTVYGPFEAFDGLKLVEKSAYLIDPFGLSCHLNAKLLLTSPKKLG